MQVVLVMFRSGGERRSFSLSRDVTIIGRREDCDLRIPVSEVSRKHCRILRDGDSLRLEDLGSSNGTFYNGQRVQSTELQPGDSIQVGPVVFVVQVDGQPPDEALDPFNAAKARILDESVAPVGDGHEMTVDEEVEELMEILPEEEVGAPTSDPDQYPMAPIEEPEVSLDFDKQES